MKNFTSQSCRRPAWNSQRFSIWLNGPSQIFDQDLQVRPVERDPALEGLAQQLVGDRHVGDDDLDAFRLFRAAANAQRAAERHEFRIALDVGDKVEHVRRAVPNASRGREFGHRRC